MQSVATGSTSAPRLPPPTTISKTPPNKVPPPPHTHGIPRSLPGVLTFRNQVNAPTCRNWQGRVRAEPPHLPNRQVFPWPDISYDKQLPPPPIHTAQPIPMQTPQHKVVDMEDEEEPPPYVNPKSRSLRAVTETAYSSCWASLSVPPSTGSSASAPSTNRASNVSSRPRRGAIWRAASASNAHSRSPSISPSDATTRLDPNVHSRPCTVSAPPTRPVSFSTTRSGPSRHRARGPSLRPDNSIDKPV